MPSGTESLNFTRDVQRGCSPQQLTPASPADSPSVDAGSHQVWMFLCSQVTVAHAQGRGRRYPPIGKCLEASRNQNRSQVPSNKITAQTLSSPFNPPHLCCPCLHPDVLSNTKYSAVLLMAIDSNTAEDALVSPTSNSPE